MNSLSTTSLPVLPIRNGVVVPNMVITIALETEDAQATVEAASNSAGRVLLLPLIDDVYAKVGVIGQLEEVDRGRRGARAAVVRTVQRARVGQGRPGSDDALWVDVEPIAEPANHGPEVMELAREYRAVVRDILDHRGMGAVAERITDMDDPGQLADLAVYSPELSVDKKLLVLETVEVRERLEMVLGWMREILADIELRDQVHRETAARIDQTQREYLLRRQLEEIRRELGESTGDLIGDYRARIAEAGLPEGVRSSVERELDRLERIEEHSPEHSWIRTWLDTILEVPWAVRSEEHLDLSHARAVLDEDHTGLEDVKDRIVEHLAVRKLRAERGDSDSDRGGSGAILLFVGPPGVGKTSLGASVARALGRRFIRMALGGVHDEAEIRGHRRTYVGARPGRIARALIEAGSMNPVLVLDELDKVGADWRGDPSAALLEVLDPAQNYTFRDHYLEVDLDLSDVLFIGTANITETTPPALLDRTEVIRLDGYSEAEKVVIARDHLLPRQLGKAGLRAGELETSDETLTTIVHRYTEEAGVRGLERQLGKLCRKVATMVAQEPQSVPVVVGPADLRELLGRPKVLRHDPADRTSVPGVATGLAVTGVGGEVLFVEAALMEGDPGLTLTGQLGDVMKESASIALSYVRANSERLGIDPSFLKRHVHLHVPAGAIPKDGPSAGITMTAALASLLTGRKVSQDVGMTGEVTLQGRVLPIGGVKQKVLAAHRTGLRQVILPSRNLDDLEDIPDPVAGEMVFHGVDTIEDVLRLALESS